MFYATSHKHKEIMKTLPSLYSLNSNGSIQKWDIGTKKNTIVKTYGQMGGKIQTSSDTIQCGKNIGRANETTAEEQAALEAQAQWEKKLKSGYTQTVQEAKDGAVDSKFVTGGVEPMLAHKFRDHSGKITFPCYAQPKLDGIRCIAVVKDGVCTLWSRTRKPITGVPHIIVALEKRFPDEDVVLDGELYNHKYKNKFEEIVSFVRQETPKEGHEVVEYHIYDIVNDSPFSVRQDWISKKIDSACLVCVPTRLVNEQDELTECFVEDRRNGYEGIMARNAESLYEHKRSYGLQKIKEFDDAEYKIVGVEAGRGRMSDCGIFVCETPKGDRFNCKMEGELEILKSFLQKPELVIGKLLTVRYQGLTNGNIPRFPIGVVVRDYE